MPNEHPSTAIENTFRRAVSAFQSADVPFLLGGSLASWARGGPQSRNDLDFIVRPQDAERALAALADGGMRPQQPPEDWLLKAWDGEVLVDVIFKPIGVAVDDGVFERADALDVLAMRVLVMSLEDVMVSKLLALNDHALDLEPALQIARALREQIDWAQVRERTEPSAYAAAFFTLIERLELVRDESRETARADRKRIRVVPDPAGGSQGGQAGDHLASPGST